MLETYRYNAGKFSVSFQVFQLSGSDVNDFLQKQSTLNFREQIEKSFHLMSFLDSQGRLEFYCWALKTKNMTMLLVPQLLKNVAHIRLEKFLISEDVLVTDSGVQDWTFILGPDSLNYADESIYSGLMFEELAILSNSYDSSHPQNLSTEEIELWRSLNGWPDFYGHHFVPEIVNNLRLYDLSVSPNKGCYPGQETVSKIATRRGAAYSPVLIETTKPLSPGPMSSFEKKIGEIEECHEWHGSYFSVAKLLRDFRVSGMKINFSLNSVQTEGIVHYYPLLTGISDKKSADLFYKACDDFKMDNFEMAEKNFKLAIKLNPQYSDAYETLGVMLGRLERYPEAIELMDQLSVLDPSSVLSHTNKSLFLMKLGKIEEAEEQKSLATVKSFQQFGNEAKLKEQILMAKKAQEDEWSKRAGMFKQVLEIDEDDTLANYGLGSIAVERQDWKTAIGHLEKVIKADPHYSVAYLSLGKAYKGNGELEKAGMIWKEGVSVAAKKGDLMPANQMQFEIKSL